MEGEGNEENKKTEHLKTEHLHIRLTEEEKEKLKEIAGQYGLNLSEFIRFLIHYIDRHGGLNKNVRKKTYRQKEKENGRNSLLF